jgi:hypothetical protein
LLAARNCFRLAALGVALAFVWTSSLAQAEPPVRPFVGRWKFVDFVDPGQMTAQQLQMGRAVYKGMELEFTEGGRFVFGMTTMGTWVLDAEGRRLVVTRPEMEIGGERRPGGTEEFGIERGSEKELVLVMGRVTVLMARIAQLAPPPPQVQVAKAAPEPTIFEKVAPAPLAPVEDAKNRPATAYLHGLWLKRTRGTSQAPTAAERWATPLSQPGMYLDWGRDLWGAHCMAVESLRATPGVGWPVKEFHCGPAEGREESIDVYETYTTRERISSTLVRETTHRRKVRTDRFTMESAYAAVTIVVRAPLGHRDIQIGVTRIVPSMGRGQRVADGSAFAFQLRGRDDGVEYDLVNDLQKAYLKEAERLAAEWLHEAEQAADEDAREEALARSALIQLALSRRDEAEVAVAYFKRRYNLTGSGLKTLTPATPTPPDP